MRSILYFVLSVLVVCQLGSCDFSYTAEDESKNLINYSFDVYRRIYNGNVNQVISPLSFRIVYSVLYQTAIGKCEESLQDHLFYGLNVTDKLQLVEGQTEILSRILASPRINAANKVYIKKGGQFRSDINALVSRYHADIEQVNFTQKEQVANEINQWVEQQTNGLIRDLVQPSSISSMTQLFFVNTLYFKANWLKPFFSDDNERYYKFFYGDAKHPNEKTIKFLTKESIYKVVFSDQLQTDVLELPYSHDSGYVFWIILPRETSSLGQLVINLNSDVIQNINDNMETKYVDLRFPIFEMESEIDGKQITPDIFGVREFNVLENIPPLEVTEIQQKVKIIVNTEGTEAAAATYMHFLLRSDFSWNGPQPLQFHANRPFVYAILTADEKEPIFIGHFAQP